MDQRIKKLWTKALRGGNYKQGRGRLRPTPDTYCCLGVLCDLYREEVGGEWDTTSYRVFRFISEVEILPTVVKDWAGIAGTDPALGTRRDAACASQLNDRGETFEYIADRIEKYL